MWFSNFGFLPTWVVEVEYILGFFVTCQCHHKKHFSITNTCSVLCLRLTKCGAIFELAFQGPTIFMTCPFTVLFLNCGLAQCVTWSLKVGVWISLISAFPSVETFWVLFCKVWRHTWTLTSLTTFFFYFLKRFLLKVKFLSWTHFPSLTHSSTSFFLENRLQLWLMNIPTSTFATLSL